MNINSLLIKPAGPDCNISCKYCFYAGKEELFDAHAHRMSIETLDTLLTQYLSTSASYLSLGFQGGEPTLMGLDFYKHTAQKIKELKRPGQNVSFSLQTNGILLNEEWASWLRENQVLVGLSVDGPEDIHDTYRRGYGDEPTHRHVAQRMAMLKKAGVDFNTLTVITAANVGRADDLIDYFLEYGSGYMQFIPCLEVPNHEVAPYVATPEQYGEFLCRAFDRWLGDGLPKFYVRLFDEMLITMMEYVPASCYFSNHCVTNFVIEHDGTVYPCDFFVLPELCLGNVHTSTLEKMAQSEKLMEFMRLKPDTDESCKRCPYKVLCGGDCLKNRFDTNGLPAGKSYFCRSYEIFFEHALPKIRALKKSLLNDPHRMEHARWMALNNTGRNDPCPCTSGLKYKNCCLNIKRV